ncbi:MAG: isoprenylcysteine carboxylmethyltransferase family protein [bacterium]
MPNQPISFNLNPSDTPVLIGVIALVLWGLSERLLHILKFHQPDAPERERFSFYWTTLSWYIAVVFSLLDSTAFHWSTLGPSLSSVRYVGIPFLVAGIVVRIVSRLTLGKEFSGYVQTIESHRLITFGIYRSIRHPAYLGYLCLLIGFPICFGSMAGFGCAIVSGIPSLIYRIRIEETALLRWFGEEYRQYQKRTSRLVPFLW